ncbi:MAG: protein-glutamate O-methyltransferase CheR [Spirochaetia bacterium]|nr:protein-glutamate O-methyltransferase CheR [Spirochaetia bacterium]
METSTQNYEYHKLQLKDHEFKGFSDLIYKLAGIHMSDGKRALIASRLLKRVKHFQLKTYADYLKLVTESNNLDERQIMVNLLTTNETYFFREPPHFEFIKNEIAPNFQGGSLRVWSAASSSGEEAYSIAMTLEEKLGPTGWEIMGSDINETVLEKARNGIYPIERTKDIPDKYLKNYCMRGINDQQGKFIIKKELKRNVTFRKVNLIEPLPKVGKFDVIILRNVLIYFDNATKKKIVDSLHSALNKDGFFIVGHSETLNNVTDIMKQYKPTIYRKT